MIPLHPSLTIFRGTMVWEPLVSNEPDVPMDDAVERAIKAAIESVPRGEWALLVPSEKTRRIYYEMRRIDAEDAVHS
jgi:hypothetical protein